MILTDTATEPVEPDKGSSDPSRGRATSMWILRAAEESMAVVRGPHIFALQEDEKEFSKGKYSTRME